MNRRQILYKGGAIAFAAKALQAEQCMGPDPDGVIRLWGVFLDNRQGLHRTNCGILAGQEQVLEPTARR